MTRYETELLAHLSREWEPKYRVGMFSMKVSPLSDECKAAIIALGTSVGLTVTFTEESGMTGGDAVLQHYVNATRTKSGRHEKIP